MKEKEIDIVLWKVAANLAALVLSELRKTCNVKSILSSIQFMSQDVNNLFANIQIPSDICMFVPKDETSISDDAEKQYPPEKKAVSMNDMLFTYLADNAAYITTALQNYFYNALVESKEKELYTKVVGNNTALPLDIEETISKLQKEQIRRNYSGLTSL